MVKHRRVTGVSRRLLPWVVVLLCCWPLGCRGKGVAPSNDPEVKQRLEKLFRLYRAYVDRHKKGPPNEEALRQFGQTMSAKEKDEHLIGDDVDRLFTSPRDNQKFVIRYNLKLEPGGPTRAVAWEATGKNGMRFVALTVGYVEEYDEETFNQYRK